MKPRNAHHILPLAAAVLALFSSCVSSPKNTESSQAAAEALPEMQEVDTAQPAPASPAELYRKKTDGITLSVASNPGRTTKLKPFSGPFILKAENSDGTPAANLEITIRFPELRENGAIRFGEQNALTAEDGTVQFMPQTPQFSFNSEIAFFPAGDMADSEIAEAAEKLTVRAPYKVQTNLKSAGGNIAIVDFSQSGKPITSNSVSSSALLMTLMQRGFTKIRNIDITNAVLADDSKQVYKEAESFVGNASAFLVYGTVKYDSVEKTSDGTKYVLRCSIKCLSMKDGQLIFATEVNSSATDKNEWNALASARKKLSEHLADELTYGI